MSNTFDKSAILDSFLDEVTSYLPDIEANLDRLQQRPDDAETIEETYRRAHTIAGSAAMMEFGGLAHVAQGMEDILGDAIDRHAGLDVPTIGLLRRSASRITKLLDCIRAGTEDTSVVQEDDADRAAWRGGAAGSQPGLGAASAAGAAPSFAASSPQQPVGPSQLPDWLAAFAPNPDAQEQQARPAAPAAGGWSAASDIAAPFGRSGPGQASAPGSGMPIGPIPAAPARDPWADSLSQFQTSQMSAPPAPAIPPGPPPIAAGMPAVAAYGNAAAYGGDGSDHGENFEDILRAFQAHPDDFARSAPAFAPQPEAFAQSNAWTPSTPPSAPAVPFDIAAAGTGVFPAVSRQPAQVPAAQPYAPAAPQPAQPAGVPSVAQDDLRAEEEAVRRHVGQIRAIAASLREAAQAMEDERAELRTFLDGSRDALDRLEDWAGQQMGLDLRHSPDSVRRYLPLSVIWVTTTRLKRLAALLTASGRNLTATQEQIEEALDDLRATIQNAGSIYSTMATLGPSPNDGFTATVAQVTWAPPSPAAPEPPAAAAAAQPPTQSLSPGARAEIEREVREQLRRELEDEVRGEIAAEVRRDEEQRLRQELQIQVRRQLLSELAPGVGGISLGGISLGGQSTGPMPVQMPFMGDRPPKAVQVTSEQSPEALEVFREEAQEHLLAITTGIAHLEANPADMNELRSIRRAMHTLKGAAGMMGFTAIQQIAHASEDLLDRLVEDSATLSSDLVGLLLDTSDTLDQLVRGLMSPEDEQHAQRRLIARYAEVTGTTVPEPAAPAASETSQAEAVAVTMSDEADEPAAPAASDDRADLSVRLQLSKLDELVNLFGELLVNRSILEERLDRLSHMVSDTSSVGERLREVGSQLETRFEAATLPSGRQGAAGPGGGQGPRWQLPGFRLGGNGRNQQSAFSQEFDELELDRYTEFHRLSRGLSEGVADIVTLMHEMETIIRECQASFSRETRLSSEFQDQLLKARLVPLHSLIPRLYRAARTSAAREGKEIEFFSEGADTEVDRKVFEEVTGPLLHLVRNAVNHGIESPSQREAAGKPRAGKITVSASYEGNQVVIAVRDDGAGIDPESIRQTAIARGWIDAYAHLSEKEAINLIFKQGMSTAKTVTEESGRGVGLDVVRDAVTRLRGTIEVESSVGQGTVFTMKFPISLQIARAVLVKVGTQTFAVPMAVVDQIGRLDYYQRVPGSPPAIEMRNERYLLAHLGQYLHVQHNPVEERSAVLLVNAGKRRVALLADAIVAQQEVVSKPLGPHLRDVPGVAGAAVLGNGQVVLILELHELLANEPEGEVALPVPGARAAREAAAAATYRPPVASAPTAAPVRPVSQPSAPRPVPAASPPNLPPWALPDATPAASAASAAAGAGRPTEPTMRREFVVARPTGGTGQHRVTLPPALQNAHLLVVDDSPSVRRVVSNMLKSHGWEVQTARDGVEALETIARDVPAAVLLDIEMPRMDGYELMATIRSQEQYRHLPLIVLTSRAAAKHQQRAIQLGADAYVVKPYQDEELLGTIAQLVQARQS